MSSNLRAGTIGFAFGIAFAAVAAQAAQPAQHEHQAAPSAQSAPAHGMDQMHQDDGRPCDASADDGANGPMPGHDVHDDGPHEA